LSHTVADGVSKSYRIPTQQHSHELVVKGSRFIAVLAHANSLAMRQQLLAETKAAYPQASHYCTAAVLGAPEDSQHYSMSDDGEPSGTAGRPMLQVLMNQPIGEVAAVVVRYFGGTKLGTGGLQRAYGQVTAEAIDQLASKLKVSRNDYFLRFDYADQAAIDYAMQQFEALLCEADYGEQVLLKLQLEAQHFEAFNRVINAQTQGRVSLQQEE